MLLLSENWKNTYPQAAIGILALAQVDNPETDPALEGRKTALEAELRARFGEMNRSQLQQLPTLQPYVTYYKKFKKTYHVLQQLESVAQKGKPIPRAAALVEAMFMAELEDQLLTAGHDLDLVQEPVSINVSSGEERYVGISGRELGTKAGDMFIADSQGILSSIVYGPDQRTRIRPETQRVLFTVYAPAGITPTAVGDHLQHIENNVRLFSPGAERLWQQVYQAA